MTDYTEEFSDLGVEKLEAKLFELIQLCEHLKAENIALRSKQASLLSERSELVDKNELARERVATILSRLKELEPEA